MPLAAESAAECVSSDKWAEASYPVIVYWVSRAPMGRTMKRKPIPPVFPLKKPVLLTREVKTDDTLAWWWGRKTRIRMMAAAPNTCHQTEMLLKMESRWLEKMLTMAARTRITMK